MLAQVSAEGILVILVYTVESMDIHIINVHLPHAYISDIMCYIYMLRNLNCSYLFWFKNVVKTQGESLFRPWNLFRSQFSEQ